VIVSWVVAYDESTLEPVLIAHRFGDGPRLVVELAGTDPEHAQVIALLGHLERLADQAPAAIALPAELVGHVAELFAWAGAERAELERAGIDAGDALDELERGTFEVELGVWPEPARVIPRGAGELVGHPQTADAPEPLEAPLESDSDAAPAPRPGGRDAGGGDG
jgi:hypothetical protein